MRNLTCGRLIKTIAFLGVAALGAADAHAGFTNVNAPIHATESSHAQILSQAYGGTFSASGVNFGNGTLTAQRLNDDSTGSDECWGNAIFSARAIARFAGAEQTFGVIDGASGAGTLQELFTVTGWGTSVSGSAVDLDLCEKTVRFARVGSGNLGDETFSSLSLDNFGAADQMVSYRLLGGPGGVDRFLLFFEDVGAGLDSDWDFNDLVVELTARPGVNAVPLPPAAWSGLAALATAGLWNGRKRIRGLIA